MTKQSIGENRRQTRRKTRTSCRGINTEALRELATTTLDAKENASGGTTKALLKLCQRVDRQARMLLRMYNPQTNCGVQVKFERESRCDARIQTIA